ncbi:MAG: hypothetical protein NVS3B16_15100 [Vulcanimicrobiaceae bacterium]
MIGSAGRGTFYAAPRAPRLAAARPTTWLRARPWLFVNFIFLLWALTPEIRRLIDWRSSYTAVSIVIALPLVGLLVPAFAYFYTPTLALIQRRVLVPLWLYVGGFVSACGIGLAAGNGLGALYSFFDFVLSALFGVWVTTLDIPRKVLYEKVASFLLNLATPVSLYAFYQFAVLPPWDRSWLMQVNAVSFGAPFPFQFRPFSTLNGPAIFADFLLGVLLLNMPRISKGGAFRILKFAIVVAALVLTRVRAEWIGAIVGLLAYVAVGPGRVRNFAIVGALAGLIALFTANTALIFGTTQADATLQQRFSTFSDIAQDQSYQERQMYLGSVLVTALQQPFGTGLGVVGPGARLEPGKNGVFDNGFVARLTEMGFFGFACYIAALGFALWLAFGRLRAFNREGDRELASIAAAAIAIQIAFDFVDISGDHHNSVAGMFFWITLGLLFGRRTNEVSRTQS